MPEIPQNLPQEELFGDDPSNKTYYIQGEFAGKAGHILQKVMVTGEPFFILRAKDLFSVMAISEYLRLIEQYAPENFEFQEGVFESLKTIKEWQKNHPEQLRYPD